MEKPVQLGGPRATVRLAKLTLKIVKRVSLQFTVDFERVADVADVVEWLEFRDATRQHHSQQSDEDVSMLPQTQVGFAAQLHESTYTSQMSRALEMTGCLGVKQFQLNQ